MPGCPDHREVHRKVTRWCVLALVQRKQTILVTCSVGLLPLETAYVLKHRNPTQQPIGVHSRLLLVNGLSRLNRPGVAHGTRGYNLRSRTKVDVCYTVSPLSGGVLRPKAALRSHVIHAVLANPRKKRTAAQLKLLE